MRWQGGRRSSNIEDARGLGSGGGRVLFGGGIGAGVIGLIIYLLGGDPAAVLGPEADPRNISTSEAPTSRSPEEDKMAEFVSVVLAGTEDVWTKLFREELGAEYQPPKLKLFTDYTTSGCGQASSASGPFYCPLDGKAYIDLSFYDELSNRFGAPGDLAMAYVVAHEIGHHVQNLLGISDKVQRARQQLSQAEGNALSVRLELQADYFAGVWAHHDQKMFNRFEEGDIEEALNAANAIGDDRLQRESQGYVVPDAFTHGSSQQRMYWFKRGFQRGTIADGDTFQEDI